MTGWKPVPPFKFKWNDDRHPGWLVRWLSPGDYHAMAIDPSDSKARFYKRENDGLLTTVATSGTALSLTTNTWYEGKVVIDGDPKNASLQRLGWDGRLARQAGR